MNLSSWNAFRFRRNPGRRFFVSESRFVSRKAFHFMKIFAPLFPMGIATVVCWAGLAAGAAEGPRPAVRRIVSLGPTVTKPLYRLGAAERVVGITTYCPQPPGGREIARIGTVVDPGIEAIVRQRPDLVLATPLTNPRRLAILRELRIPVVEIDAAKTFEEICARFREIGERVGRAERAGEIVARAQRRMEALQRRLPGKDRPTVFLQIGARPLSTAGGNNFLNDMIIRAGGVNIAGNAETISYSREAVLAADPDCILIVTMGLTGPDEKRKWERYETLQAVASGRVHMLDSERVCSPTPESFVEGVERIASLLYPELGAAPGKPPAPSGPSR